MVLLIWFAGGPGTGKSLAAEVLAEVFPVPSNTLQLDTCAGVASLSTVLGGTSTAILMYLL